MFISAEHNEVAIFFLVMEIRCPNFSKKKKEKKESFCGFSTIIPAFSDFFHRGSERFILLVSNVTPPNVWSQVRYFFNGYPSFYYLSLLSPLLISVICLSAIYSMCEAGAMCLQVSGGQCGTISPSLPFRNRSAVTSLPPLLHCVTGWSQLFC